MIPAKSNILNYDQKNFQSINLFELLDKQQFFEQWFERDLGWVFSNKKVELELSSLVEAQFGYLCIKLLNQY